MTVEDEVAGLVREYELTQRNRVATQAHLRAIRAGTKAALRAPSPTLEVVCRAEHDAERALAKAMGASVARHPTWPWLKSVRGIGPILSARLIARLRIERAPTPSSFWSYCGLSTVPATRYGCRTCGVTLDFPSAQAEPRRHRAPGGAACDGILSSDVMSTARVAVRYAGRGQRRAFDAEARTLCHLIGVSFLRRGRSYRAVYDVRRERLRAERPAWSPNHTHLASMRVMEKLFLAHLWHVWAEACGVPVRLAYEVTQRGKAGTFISPWEMLDK